MGSGLRLALVSLMLVAPLGGQGRFPPDSFTNLKVLPKTIDQRTLLATMRGFTQALGVRCAYCHAGQEGQPLDSFNFAADDKRTKLAARAMMHMVMHINEEHLADVPDRPMPHVEVRCMTCHRGIARPRLIDDDLALMLADSGAEAAVRRYRDLRQRYYGSGSYDFREVVLNGIANGEVRAGRAANALALLAVNAEFYPASGQIAYLQGEAQLVNGDTATALASFRTALQRDSTVAPARRRLAELGRPGQAPR